MGEQQGVVVVRRRKGGHTGDAVASGPILDHDWLAPALAELVSVKARREVDGRASSSRNDEADRALGPMLAASPRLQTTREQTIKPPSRTRAIWDIEHLILCKRLYFRLRRPAPGLA